MQKTALPFRSFLRLLSIKKQEVNSCDGIYLLSCFYIAFTPMVWVLIVFYLITFTTFCEPSAYFVTTMLRPLTAVLLATPAGV